MSALILCAALSVVCVGVLSLSQQGRRHSDRQIRALQTEENHNEALLRLGVKVLSAAGGETIREEINVRGQSYRLIAESETAKWPLDKASEVSAVTLAHRTRAITAADVARIIADGPKDARLNNPFDDCVRQLFSPYGYADPSENRTPMAGLIASRARDGEVWRLRAITGPRVTEQMVRFTGDAHQPYALISIETYSLTERPECAL